MASETWKGLAGHEGVLVKRGKSEKAAATKVFSLPPCDHGHSIVELLLGGA